MADTMRSSAMLISGAFSYYTNLISPDLADAAAALVVSLAIFGSCVPLVQGLVQTFRGILVLKKELNMLRKLAKHTISLLNG